MYRLTVRIDRNPFPTMVPIQQRVYRWGPNWGIYRPSLREWRAEKRTLIESSTDQLFESIDILNVQAPPVRADDVWDEEIIVSNNVEYNGLVSICASAAEIKRWCNANNIPVLRAVEQCAASDSNIENPPRQQRQQHPPRQQRQNQYQRPPTAPQPRPAVCLIDA